MSTIKLYTSGKNSTWKLIASKLFKVDDISSYLATFTPTTINDFQYIKQGLEISIKIDAVQANAQPNSSLGYKYVSIINDNENIAYYYVRKTAWRSKNTIQLDLVMDVLNTYTDGTDYVFKANTRIIREHKDRLKAVEDTGHMYFILSNMNESDILDVGDYISIYTYPDNDYLGYAQVESINYGEEVMWARIITDNGITEVETPINLKVMHDIEGEDPVLAFYATLNDYKFRKDVYRNIDSISENINPLLQCGNGNGSLVEDESPLNTDWYLLYRNQNDPSESLVNPVDCFLIPAVSTPVSTGSITNGKVTASSLEYGKYYYINLQTGESVTLSNGVNLYGESSYARFVCVQKNTNNTLTVTFINEIIYPYQVLDVEVYNDVAYINLDQLPTGYMESNSHIDIDSLIGSYSETGQWDEDVVSQEIDPVALLDKTDAKNIKLIKLPYCPYDFTITDGKLDIASSAWNYEKITQANGDFYCLKLTDLNNKLTRNIKENNSINPFSNIFVDEYDNLNPQLSNLRVTNRQLESKMYHSEFYAPKLVYDSFTFDFELEKINQEYYYDTSHRKLSIKFIMTRTINSRFMFQMSSLKFALSNSNYAQYVPIARNNEEVLYNVPYIQYVRTGINYDVKSKNLQLTSNLVGTGLSVASIGASLLLPSVPLKVAGVVGSLVSMAMSVKSTIVSAVQNEEALKQKELQLKNQTASVAGSDDVDLMSEYAQNRLKYLEYIPTPNMYHTLEELFFYAGYTSNRMGTPSHNTRVNFDYLECEASLEATGANIPQDILDEITNAFKAGVTFIHKTTRATDAWDMEQKYENWEKELMEE